MEMDGSARERLPEVPCIAVVVVVASPEAVFCNSNVSHRPPLSKGRPCQVPGPRASLLLAHAQKSIFSLDTTATPHSHDVQERRSLHISGKAVEPFSSVAELPVSLPDCSNAREGCV